MLSRNILNLAAVTATASGDVTSAQPSGQPGGYYAVSDLERITIDINISAVSGTNPTCTFWWERLGLDGNWYTVWSSSSQTGTGTVSQTIGPGCQTDADPGAQGKLGWTIGGTTPSFTFTASITGK